MTIFIIGHLCIDRIIIDQKTEPPSMGGTAAFSSVVCSRLGAPEKVFVVSKIGPDFPEAFLTILKKSGVDTRYISYVKRYSTRYELIYTGDDRELTLKSVCAPITLDDLPQEIFNAKLIYFGPIANEIPLQTIIAIKEQANSLVALDIQGLVRHQDHHGKLYFRSNPKIDEVLSYIDIVKLDLKEAQILTGASKIRDISSYLSNLGVKMAIITKSRKGSVLYYERKLVKIPTVILHRIYSATGAGDCFFSSFLIEYLKTKDPLHAARFATKVVSYLIGSPDGIQSFFVKGDIYKVIEDFIEKNRVD